MPSQFAFFEFMRGVGMGGKALQDESVANGDPLALGVGEQADEPN